MKIQILRLFVLLISISAASVLVWNATRDKKSKQVQKEDMISPSSMQGSSKQKAVVDSGMIFEFEQETFVYEVTDEEVKRTRDMMLSTSKSGIIMSDDKIREMLEAQRKERKLMPSSKSIDAILKPKDVEEMVEGREPRIKLIPSTKNPGRILDKQEVKEIIEGEKSDFEKPVEPALPPQETDK
jgi:hypothetical protein